MQDMKKPMLFKSSKINTASIQFSQRKLLILEYEQLKQFPVPSSQNKRRQEINSAPDAFILIHKNETIESQQIQVFQHDFCLALTNYIKTLFTSFMRAHFK
jgi:hypothetical protein